MGHSFIRYGEKVVRTKQSDLLCALIVREAGALGEASEVRRGVEPFVQKIEDMGYYYYDCAIDLAKVVPTRDGLLATVKLLEHIIAKIEAFGAAFPEDYVAGLPCGQMFKKTSHEGIVVTEFVRELAVEVKKMLTDVLSGASSSETGADRQG